MRDLRVRKRIRLSGYDYSSEGYYFITICVRDGHEILSEIVGANCVRPHLTEIGVVVENEILRMTLYTGISSFFFKPPRSNQLCLPGWE